MNLIEMLLKNFSPDVIAKLAPMLGISIDQAKSGITAMLPALLGGLLGSSSSASGAQKLNDAVNQADPNVLDNLSSALSGGSITDLASKGSSLLGGLLGGSAVSGLSTVLSKFTGLPAGVVTTALGFLTPMLLGGMKKASASAGLAPAALLAGQRNNIMGAIPAGLGSMLGSVPGLGFAPTSQASVSPDQTSKGTGKGSGGLGFLLPLAALLAVAAIAYWMFTRNTTPTNTPNAQGTPSGRENLKENLGGRVESAAADVADAMGLSVESATQTIGSLGSELGKITDVATAEAALPKLKEIASAVEKMDGLAKLMPADAKASFTAGVKPLLDPIKATAEKLYALPGVGEKLKPVLDPILAKLNAIVG